MSLRRKKTPSLETDPSAPAPIKATGRPAGPGVLRIRRCHICDTVNEVPLSEALRKAGDEEVLQSCSHCGKHLAPFLFFEESGFDGVNADGYFLSELSSSGGYRPLWGFLAFWPEEGSRIERHPDKLSRHVGRRDGGKK